MSARKSTTPRTKPKSRRKKKTHKDYQPRRSWDKIIERLTASTSGIIRVTMGSIQSAQVTRCRLLKDFSGITAHTEGKTIIISV